MTGDSHITECPGYVRVDFDSCNDAELDDVYRAFAALCIDKQVNRALLKAGDDYAPGHYGLRNALQAMAVSAPIRDKYCRSVSKLPSLPRVSSAPRRTFRLSKKQSRKFRLKSLPCLDAQNQKMHCRWF